MALGTARIEDAIKEWFGERCNPPMDEPGCPACDAWAEFDALNSQALRSKLRQVTEEDVSMALDGAYIGLPVTTPVEAVELVNVILDRVTGERGRAEAKDVAKISSGKGTRH